MRTSIGPLAGRAGHEPAWRVVLALLPAAMLACVLARPVWDVDVFWQLRLGELILARGGPVFTEPFSALHLGAPMTTISWLGQAIMAGVRRAGGWNLLRVFDALCWLGGFWAVAAACRTRGASAMAVSLALLVAFLPACHAASIRPQSFAALCFGLLLALERLRWRPAATIACGMVLMVLWQNLHPSVSVGALAMGCVAASGWIGHLRKRAAPPWAASVLALFGGLAMFLTPDGAGILEVSARNAETSMAIGASEWLPLWAQGNLGHALPIAVAALFVAGLAWHRRARIAPAEAMVVLALFALTLVAYRFVLFWAIALVPPVARLLSAPAGEGEGHRAVRAVGVWSALVPLALVAAATPVVLPLRFADTLPIAAVDRLAHEGVRGTVYGDFPFGGLIIDRGYPAWKVAYDGRYYRYSRDEWRYNGGIENGLVPLVDVVRKWRPAAFVLDRHHNAPLARELARSRAWRRIHDDGRFVVYVPRVPGRFTRPA